ncbi:hypothetical protein GUJ93_ZPchr0009g701 [Zizania palustris]|uniref:Uncharacterized protein n=1 Tax=Zizania palustris TaxID=103762 RepID=A0A8J5RM28_ZIZPA|nr:hypothetical protein GUJ93_ZPchr0009g701 [Zizania palustris]
MNYRTTLELWVTTNVAMLGASQQGSMLSASGLLPKPRLGPKGGLRRASEPPEASGSFARRFKYLRCWASGLPMLNLVVRRPRLAVPETLGSLKAP